jgi:hypothetical protein
MRNAAIRARKYRERKKNVEERENNKKYSDP